MFNVGELYARQERSVTENLVTVHSTWLTLKQKMLAGIAISASCALVLPTLVWAAPSQDDIDRAKAEEAAVKLSVAQIEVELANVSNEVAAAQKQASIAAEKYNGARVALEEATKAAKKAEEDAKIAEENYQQGRRDIASVVQTAYRNGGSGLDGFAPYLEADGLRQVEQRKNSLDAIGDAASVKMQKVTALEQVSKLMKNVSEKARVLQAEKTAEVEAQAKEAQQAVDNLAQTQRNVEIRRQALYAELARKQNTTVELIKQKEAAEAEARRRAEEEAARRALEEAQRRLEAQRRQEEQARRDAQAQAAAEESYTPPASSGPAYVPPPATPPNYDKAQGAIAAAKSMLGAPYVWGGEGGADGGYDCSGMVTVAYRTQGIYLEHWSVGQYRYGATGGQYVPLSQAAPGDLVFWSHNGTANGVYHVAMYLGGGQIIEAATFGIPLRITSMYDRWEMMPYAVRVV